MSNKPINRKNKEFLNPYVSVDVVLFMVHENKLQTLLINRDNAPFEGMWALPGAFPLKGERTEDTARRVLKQKVGLDDQIYIEQLYTFDTPGRDPRETVFSVTYFGLVAYDVYQHINLNTSQMPTLFSVEALPKLAFDHREIIAYAKTRLQAKLGYTNIAYAALPTHFTFTKLQTLYETILKQKMDKRNFRKKIEQLNIIKKTKKKLTGMKQRPATLYEFRDKRLVDTGKFW